MKSLVTTRATKRALLTHNFGGQLDVCSHAILSEKGAWQQIYFYFCLLIDATVVVVVVLVFAAILFSFPFLTRREEVVSLIEI
jgi:hypothetical protein